MTSRMTEAESERAAVVAWLRKLSDADKKPFDLVQQYGARWSLRHAADAIERGDHK